jgi:o-succinylbenzoate synthase
MREGGPEHGAGHFSPRPALAATTQAFPTAAGGSSTFSMRTLHADVMTYRGRVSGARGARSAWSTREGLLLQVTTADGIVGQGEASPLPGYSPDTLEDAAAALGAVDWTSIPAHEVGASTVEWLGRFAAATRLPASAQFALETALLDITSQRLREPLWTLLRRGLKGAAGEDTPVPLCTLAGGAGDAGCVGAARAAAERGVHTVKVKITGPSLGAQVETLAQVREAIGHVALRLDANRTFSPPNAWQELSLLRAFRPEFIEEPVPTDTLERLSELPVPLALDESLQEPGRWERLEPRLVELGCVAVVLKPMALGGMAVCLDLAARAKAHGLDVTVSHAFDGPVALAAAAHLALAIASRTRASGLDRHGGLAAWPDVEVPHLGSTSVLVADRPGLGLPPLPGSR